jgi:hypothetical protein
MEVAKKTQQTNEIPQTPPYGLEKTSVKALPLARKDILERRGLGQIVTASPGYGSGYLEPEVNDDFVANTD